MSTDDTDLGEMSLLDLFRMEVEAQTRILNDQLLSLEQEPANAGALEIAMRAAHSMKGAARMVDIEAAVRITHILEDVLVAAQGDQLTLTSETIDTLLQSSDLILQIAEVKEAEYATWFSDQQTRIDDHTDNLSRLLDSAPAVQSEVDDEAYPAINADDMMLELFHSEMNTHSHSIREELERLERTVETENETEIQAALDQLIDSSFAIKGAARLVDVTAADHLAAAMEASFNHIRQNASAPDASLIEQWQQGEQFLTGIARLSRDDSAQWMSDNSAAIRSLVNALTMSLATPSEAVATESAAPPSPSADEIDLPEISTTAFSADAGMLDLFRIEVENQGAALTEGLLALEQDPTSSAQLELLMRASHSIKGAARMVGIDCGVQVAHVMEDVFVAAQTHAITLNPDQMDVLLRGTDMLAKISRVEASDSGEWLESHVTIISNLIVDLQRVLKGETPARPIDKTAHANNDPMPAPAAHDSAIRVSAENLNRLMGLAGEVRVESRWLRPFSEAMVQIKHRQAELIALLDRLGETLDDSTSDHFMTSLLSEAQHKADQCRHGLSDRLNELDEYDRRSHNLADRLNREVVASRMRPFGDGVQGFQRMVRDLSRSLGKKVQLNIRGLTTQVDRDILSKMEAPLNHLVRNAVDHGIETPEQRRAACKPEQATITIETVHSSGMLSIIVRDDGRGIDPETLRKKVVERGLTVDAMAENLSDAELMEFLFLPSFSTRDEVTEISGRGVGLDVVHSTVQEMRGVVRATSTPGQGLQFHMQLPLTLSVVRALLVEIGGEPYAFPLARIDRTLKLHRDNVEVMEGRQYFTLGSQHIGVLSANQVLELLEPALQQDELPIVVLGERLDRYGVVVDRFLGERNLVVQTLDPRLGKVQDVGAAAILENGAPCLILDVDDLLRSVDILVSGGRLDRLDKKAEGARHHRGKRVLVVDDSITVREVERNMLVTRGYEVDVAVDGMDGWNAVRTGHYDLVISDVDMPRMNGFEFVEHIKEDPTLKATPVMIVSYKDREEDRARGLEVGADYYLTKGSFHDETLLDAVTDLIGEA